MIRRRWPAWSGALAVAFAWAVAGPAPGLAQDPDPRPGIAVMPFSNNYVGSNAADFEGLEAGLQQMMITELSQNSALRVVERGELARLTAEQELGATGRVDAATAARVGRIVGARYMILGSYNDIFGDVRMDVRIVDVETSEILRTEQVRDSRENLYRLLVDLAAQVVAGVELPALAAEVQQARRDRAIPTEAVSLYARAQLYADGGDTERAIRLYRQLAEQFPALTEAREALRQLGG